MMERHFYRRPLQYFRQAFILTLPSVEFCADLSLFSPLRTYQLPCKDLSLRLGREARVLSMNIVYIYTVFVSYYISLLI